MGVRSHLWRSQEEGAYVPGRQGVRLPLGSSPLNRPHNRSLLPNTHALDQITLARNPSSSRAFTPPLSTPNSSPEGCHAAPREPSPHPPSPCQVVITNLPESHQEEVQARRFPGRSEDTYSVPLTRVVYIESTDLMEVDEKDYYGLAPGMAVMLN